MIMLYHRLLIGDILRQNRNRLQDLGILNRSQDLGESLCGDEWMGKVIRHRHVRRARGESIAIEVREEAC